MLPIAVLKQIMCSTMFFLHILQKELIWIFFFWWYHKDLKLKKNPTKIEKKNVFRYVLKTLFTISSAIFTLCWKNQICQVRATHHYSNITEAIKNITNSNKASNNNNVDMYQKHGALTFHITVYFYILLQNITMFKTRILTIFLLLLNRPK